MSAGENAAHARLRPGIPGRRSGGAWSVLAALLLALPACFQEIEAPTCRTLADCPAGKGYTACEDGRCFEAGRCDGARPSPGDGCCSAIEGDRSADTDCLVADIDLECREPAGPVIDPEGVLHVTCRSLEAGVSSVILRRVRPDGTVWPATLVGSADLILPPVVSRSVHVYAAFAGGVARYDAASGELVDRVASDAPVGGLASTGGGPSMHSVVGWPTASGAVVLYDEDRQVPGVYTAGPRTKGQNRAFPPTVSAGGRRLFVLWVDGTLWGLETVANPAGPVSSAMLPGKPVAAPVEVDGRVYVALEGGRLLSLIERAPDFDTAWVTDLDGEVAGGLLVDPSGAIVVVLASGAVAVVRDLVDRGSLVGRGDLGTAVGAVHPLLGEAPRVVAVTLDGRGVRSLLRREEGGGISFDPGLSFDVPVAIVGSPLLAGRQLWFATESGRLVAWQFHDDPPAGRFVRAGADASGSGRTSPMVP